MRHSLWAHPVAALTPFVLGATLLPDAARAEVTCSCHKGLVRGSVVQDSLISSKAYGFGSWEIPIRFQATETGGGCFVGCHRTLRYDRVKPVVQ
ncbi:hypothetical protein [Citrifermentans bremense]|uniref:hypothetical protein n=1 Tax=Citrifermentans bremense TaxID=60035 RepID=UPI000423B21E|nr:hypothetical protein [Citrifermentans bremense]